MKVHICDTCRKEIKGAMYVLEGFHVVMLGEKKYQINEREFCSLHCQQQYIINGMKGRGLDDHIKV